MSDVPRMACILAHAIACGFAFGIAQESALRLSLPFALIALYHLIHAVRHALRFALGTK
jgi:hypothetical protein